MSKISRDNKKAFKKTTASKKQKITTETTTSTVHCQNCRYFSNCPGECSKLNTFRARKADICKDFTGK